MLFFLQFSSSPCPAGTLMLFLLSPFLKFVFLNSLGGIFCWISRAQNFRWRVILDSLKLREGFFQDFCVCFFKLIIFVYVLALCYEFFFSCTKSSNKKLHWGISLVFCVFYFFFLTSSMSFLKGEISIGIIEN